MADVVNFSLLEVETTKNGNLKPQLSEFKNKLYEDYIYIHSKDLKVCVNGLTTKRINIDEFLSKQWSDAYFYMIKFTDNNKAIKTLNKLDTYTEKNELIEYFFDSESKTGGPRKIEIFQNEEHQLHDYNELTLDFFLESTKEIRQSRPHNFSKDKQIPNRSLSKPKVSKNQLKQNIKKDYATDAEHLIKRSSDQSKK